MADCIYRRRSSPQVRRLPGSRALAVSVFLLLGTTVYGASDEPAVITGVRFWSLGDVTRVAIEADTDFQGRKSSRLTNPERLFFDIADAHPETKGAQTVQVGDGLLKRIRIAQTQKNVTRVVLDLETEAIFRTSQLRNPSRLIIEMRAKGSAPPPPTEEKSHKDDKPHAEPKTEPVELVGNGGPFIRSEMIREDGFVGPKVATHSQITPRRFNPPPVDQLPPPPARPLPNLVYTTPPPAFSLFAKPAKLPGASIVATAKYSPPKYVPPAAGPDLPRETPKESAVLGRAPIPARRNSDGGQTMTRVLGLKLGRVVIDAGHGGHDDGTHGSSGMKEKDLVLDVALRVGALLEQRLGSEVVYTRSDDTFIPLEERTRIANEKRADLFLSIHANSSPDRSASGIETYYLSLNGAKVSLDTAARENAGSQRSIFDLKELLTKIALKDKIDESREFASAIQSSLFSLTQKNGKSSHDRGTKRAPFIVLIGAEMPSVLAEIGFLTNSSEESLLRKDEYRDKVADALFRGVESYAETLSRTVVARSK